MTTPDFDRTTIRPVPEWNRLDEDDMDDLYTWYNVSEPDDDEKALLGKLYAAERFRAWDCEECGDRCHRAEISAPFSWDDFQGVRQDETNHESLCSDCVGKLSWECRRISDLLGCDFLPNI